MSINQTERELVKQMKTHHRRTVVHPLHLLPFLLAGQAQFQLFLSPRLGMGQLGLLPLLPLWGGSMVNGCWLDRELFGREFSSDHDYFSTLFLTIIDHF
jgi:hypothetical protein